MEIVRDSVVRSIACLNFVVFTIHCSPNEHEPRQTVIRARTWNSLQTQDIACSKILARYWSAE
jgi:hypothetical protein